MRATLVICYGESEGAFFIDKKLVCINITIWVVLIIRYLGRDMECIQN